MDALLKKINSKNVPVEVIIRIENYSTKENCFYNVLDKISVDKGEIVYGWKLHKSSFLEQAERHAVWKSPTGKLIDITPDDAYSHKILFLEEDTDWEYDGKYTDNVRVNIHNNPLVDDYILLCETITKLWQTGKRESKSILMIHPNVIKIINLLNEDKIKREKFIVENNGMESICYCGQNLNYNYCHGFDLGIGFSELLSHVNTNYR